jgi:replicative DNA helicase
MSHYDSMRLPKAVPVGFDRLDDLTGGFAPGRVWIVIGTPGQGRTTLLVQWAAMLATRHDWPTWLATPREEPMVVAARLLAATGKIPLRDLLSHSIEPESESRFAAAQTALGASPLQVHFSRSADAAEAIVSPYSSRAVPMGRPCALVLDDADLVDWCNPQWALELARQGVLLILSLPRHILIEEAGLDSDLSPTWARTADVVLEVRSRGPIPKAPPEGEADLSVLKHRRGPTTVARVAFQGHYSRFVDLNG